VVIRDINQWIAGTSLKTHTRNLVLNFLTKPSLPLPNHHLPGITVIRHDTLNNNASRNATSQPRNKKRLMSCYCSLTTLSKGMTSHSTPNTFIADSGATCHMRGSFDGMFNFKPHVSDIMVGYNETMSSVSKGYYNDLVIQKDDLSFEVILQDVLYIPELMFNLSI
jgi:hypothetical protein